MSQNFKHEKSIWDHTLSYSFRKWNAEKSKNLENRTTFSGAYLQSKFQYITPIMNYSLYQKNCSQIFVVGVGKKLNNFWSPCTYIYWQEENQIWKFYIWGSGHPLKIGVLAVFPYFQGVARPPNVKFSHLIFYLPIDTGTRTSKIV